MSNRKNRRMFFKKRKYGIVLRGMFFRLAMGDQKNADFWEKDLYFRDACIFYDSGI